MPLRKDVRELLSQLPGRYAQLESVRFLKDPRSFYREVPKSDIEVAQEVSDLLSKYPEQFTKKTAYRVVPKTKVEWVRPAWLGPEPTIVRLSDVPVDLSDAFEVAHALELVEVYWDPDGDAHLYLSDKGRASLVESEDERQGATLLERVLSKLTKRQQLIVECLWRPKTTTYKALRAVPGAFAAGVTDEAITQQIKRINGRLAEHGLPVSLAISGLRVNLDRPPD
jgi:hypothetical protein